MSKRVLSVIQRINNFLFGQEEEHFHDDKSENTKRNDQEITARVIHHYPQKGNFRFPIIEDTYSPDRNVKTVVQNNRTERRVEKEFEDNKLKLESRKKFTGSNFKATNIPSPIYGFDRRETHQKEIVSQELQVDDFMTNSVERHIEPIDPLLFFTKEELDQSLDIDEDILVESENQAESEQLTETIFVEENKGRIKEEDEHNVTKPISELPEDHIQDKKDHTDTIDESIELEKKEQEQEPERKSESHTTITSTKEEKVSKTEKQAPFNVLMFHKDRAALKRKANPNQYQFPQLQLLNIPPKKNTENEGWLEDKKQLLELTLANFNVQAKVVGVTKGPSVTRFEIQPEAGVKVSKVTSLTDDIKLSLAASDIRIEAPIPGRNAIGIEVPNDISEPVVIREVLRSAEFLKSQSPMTVAMGFDIAGKPIVTDLQKMPHGLIAGATGSGKSVCINSILVSLMFKASPDEVKLMLIDPKMVELAPYNDVPHLVTPVITDAKQATIALKWAVEEMERRYELFVQNGVRDIKKYNEVMKTEDDSGLAMPYIVVVIDELADLMMVAAQDVEEAICRIAQKARACGIHLLVATQRPSVDVITGLIKANIPTRIAFSVSSQADSRTIIDSGGAERLLGKGDMLLFENGASKPVRVQGNYISDEEIDRVIEMVKKQREPNYLFDKEQLVKSVEASIDQEDELFEEACHFVIEQGGASSSSLQRRFRIGFNRAARLIEMMEARGIISEAMGSKPRNVLMTQAEVEEVILK